jgi:2-dehydropantoate 2-reductase
MGGTRVKVGIIGAGALGSAIGGTLVQAGHDFLLVNRDRTHVEAINRNGLVMRAEGKDRVVSIRAAIPSEAGGPVDLVIVLVKSFHTAEAIRVAIGLVGPETTMLSLQTGLGHEDIRIHLIGRDRVIAGKTYIGGAMLGPGHVIAGVQGKETIIGELDGRITPRIERIRAAFQAAGMPLVVSSNILGAMLGQASRQRRDGCAQRHHAAGLWRPLCGAGTRGDRDRRRGGSNCGGESERHCSRNDPSPRGLDEGTRLCRV